MAKCRPLAERFWPKVNQDGPIPDYAPHLGPCWLWTAYTNDLGYGMMGRGGAGAGMVRAHRVAYELLVGPIPEGMQLDHLCRVRNCVNPKHLEPVTNLENLRRSPIRPEARTHCPQGHPYDEANTYVSVNDVGGPARRCRICNAANAREYRRRRREGGSVR